MIVTIRRVLAVLAVAVLASAFGVAAAKDKAPATVVCKDGSTDDGGRGACRGHGGVDKAATKAKAGGEDKSKAEEKPSAKADKAKDDTAAEAMVTCKDGSQSKGGRGACRGHGGVDKGGSAKAASPATTKAAAPAATKPAEAAATKPAETAAAKTTSKAAAKDEDQDASKGPPTAKCKDGTLSFAKHHSGACSRHGGVAEWMDKK